MTMIPNLNCALLEIHVNNLWVSTSFNKNNTMNITVYHLLPCRLLAHCKHDTIFHVKNKRNDSRTTNIDSELCEQPNSLLYIWCRISFFFPYWSIINITVAWRALHHQGKNALGFNSSSSFDNPTLEYEHSTSHKIQYL